MKKAILAHKVLASVLAIGLGGFGLPLAAQANSGLSDKPQDVTGGNDFYYIGSNGAADNVVIIDSDLPDEQAKGVIGGYTKDSDAVKNSVTVSGGEVGNIYGGRASYGNATGNEVSISGGTVTGKVYGGDGGYVKKNIVNISGGTVGDVYGGETGWGNAKDNKVIISGGMVTGKVYGGSSNLYNGEVTGNSITLSATADVSQANLYGGYSRYNDATVENNKLIINGWSGTVGSLHNFNGAEGGIEVKALAGGLDLAADKKTAFIFAENGINNCNNDKLIKAENIQAGVALTVSGEIGISEDDKNIYIKPTSVRASDQTAITTESRAAAAAFVNQGAEAVSDSINSLQGAEAGISTFATVSGNNSKYDTGSYVDINGWNGIVGVAKTKDLNAGKFSYGAFFENGGGNYNTYNNFNGTSFRGDGNVVYNGGGLLMRYEQEDGVYTEASLRAGTAKNEVSNALEFADNRYGFKTENAYYGAHIGIGKIIKLDNGKAWDIYGKYFHTHHEGDSVKIANDVFDFDSVDSDKLRIGARFSEQQGEKLTSYYGLAWEYEFSGDAGGTANHYAMYTPSLEGSTVIGEVGFRYTPGKASPWYFDANVRGYAGMQEGISGSVQAVYSF